MTANLTLRDYQNPFDGHQHIVHINQVMNVKSDTLIIQHSSVNHYLLHINVFELLQMLKIQV